MAEATKIEWADHTFNPWRGCEKISPGCDHCYAEAMSRRNPAVLGTWGADGERVLGTDAYWSAPKRWNRRAAEAGVRRRVFCASLADVFEDRPELVYWRDELFRLIDETPNLDWLLLTKRPENIRRMWPPFNGTCVQSMTPEHWGMRNNAWILTSVEDQPRADERIPHLLECRDLSPVLGLSCEPLLGPLDLSPWLQFQGPGWRFSDDGSDAWPGLDWIIVGGESGPHARPMHPDWARKLRDQCVEASVPFFFKQWGEWSPHRPDNARFRDVRIDTTGRDVTVTPGLWDDSDATMYRVGKRAAGRLLDGREWNEFPDTMGVVH